MNKCKNISENKSGFKVPENYFSSLENSLLNKVKLNSASQKSGFKVPDNYFSEFELNTPSVEKRSKVIRLKDWSKWAAAASIVAVSILGALYIDSVSSKSNLQFSDLDNDMIERYLDFNLETPDEFIDFDNTSINSNLNLNISKLKDQDIINYLNDKLDDQDFDNEN